MANPKAQIYSLPLQGEGSEINLTTYKADISPFQGYNVKNAPFYGGTLSPMWMKEDNSLNTSEVYISHNGDKYYVTGNQFYKNNTQIGTISQTGFHEEIINDDYYDYYDNNFYIKKTSPTTYHLHINMGDNDVVNTEVTAPSTEELKTVLLKENPTRVYCAMIGKYYYCYRKGSEAVHEPRASAFGQFSYDSSDLHNVIVHNNCVIFQNGDSYLVAEYNSLNSNYNVSNVSTNPFEYQNGNVGPILTSHLIQGNDKVHVYERLSSPYGLYFYKGIQSVSIENNEPVIQLVDRIQCQIGPDDEVSQIEGEEIYSLSTIYDTYYTYTAHSETKHDVSNMYTQYILGFINCGTQQGKVFDFEVDDGGKIQNPFGYYINPSEYSNRKNWRLLMNKGLIQGISYADNENNRGTLVTPWLSVSNDKNINIVKVGGDIAKINYFSEQIGKWISISTTNTNVTFTVIDDRYIIFNTTQFNNAYDIEANIFYHFADDWNNRLSPIYQNTGSQGITAITKEHKFDDWKKEVTPTYVASAVNPKYEITRRPFCSSILAPIPVVGIYGRYGNTSPHLYANQGILGNEPIDIYSNLKYDKSIYKPLTLYNNSLFAQASGFSKNAILEGTTYPLDTNGNAQLNIPIMFTYIPTTTNQDLIKLAGNTVYSLVYYNNQPIFLYYLGTESSLYGMETAFVIQGQNFAIANNKIIQYSIQNGIISNTNVIVDITGLKFIAATPYQAVFWSDTNHTLYSFTGDRLLAPMFQADSINMLGNSKYNPATESIIIPTDIGLFILGNGSSFILDDYKETQSSKIKDIFLLDDSVAFIKNNGIVYMSYNKKSGFSPLPIKLETKFYGLGNNVLSVNDTLYMRLYNDDPTTEGTVKLKTTTLTNIGVTTEEKEVKIKPSDWDKLTNTYYLRYQPKNQRSIGANYSIQSDFRISYIGIGNKPDTVQISDHNF